ncbi:MAG: DUF4212 domain-containing protein [Planctomycetota bacterium]
MPSPDSVAEVHSRHWRRTVRLTLVLLFFWAFVGLGCGILFADVLSEYTFLGFPLGFWFAQQGSIVVFVVLVLVYALAMARFDRQLRQELASLPGSASSSTENGEVKP